MTKNPFINAFCSLGYIVFVTLIMNFVMRTQGSKPDTFFAPVAFLSMFTLSAAIMGYLFLYQPLLLILDGQKKAGLNLFLRTVAVFAAATVFVFILVFLGLF